MFRFVCDKSFYFLSSTQLRYTFICTFYHPTSLNYFSLEIAFWILGSFNNTCVPPLEIMMLYKMVIKRILMNLLCLPCCPYVLVFSLAGIIFANWFVWQQENIKRNNPLHVIVLVYSMSCSLWWLWLELYGNMLLI